MILLNLGCTKNNNIVADIEDIRDIVYLLVNDMLEGLTDRTCLKIKFPITPQTCLRCKRGDIGTFLSKQYLLINFQVFSDPTDPIKTPIAY